MAQVVQAKCPYCKNTLRIPSDWLNQPMRCKHCGQTFQSKAKAGPPPVPLHAAPVSANGAHVPSPPPVPMPASAAPVLLAPAHAVSNDPFGFDPYEDDPGHMNRPPRGRSKGGWWTVVFLGGGVVVAATLFLVFAGAKLNELFSKKDGKTKDKDKDGIAQLKDKGKDAAALDKGADDKSADDKSIEDKGRDDGPKKIDPVKKTDSSKKIDGANKDKGTKVPTTSDAFPRRALLISVNNYLFLNPLHHGSPLDTDGKKITYPGSTTFALKNRLSFPPMNFPATQITELSDGILATPKNAFDAPQIDSKRAWPTLKAVLERSITDFLDTSRAQDRIMILFAGHAVEIDKEAYLIPVEGNKDDAKTLIPLSWVYQKMAECKARQKVLVLDVFRFPPARGLELPATGEMTEDFDAKLLNPPAGVQVWSSCIKSQQGLEFEKGSLFLQALCGALQERGPGIAFPNEPLALQPLVAKVNKKMKEFLDPQKMEQVSRLTGKEPDDGAPYDPQESMPTFTLRPPTPPGGNTAGRAQIAGILDELKILPPYKISFKPIAYESLPPFPSKGLELYKTDYTTMKDLRDKIAADKDKYALRAAVLEISAALEGVKSMSMREYLANPGAAVSPKLKADFLNQQKAPALAQFELEEVLKKALKAGEKRGSEVSQRWHANYDFAMARLMSRLVYIYEYNNILAKVRNEDLPTLEKIHNGYRVGAAAKPQVKDVPQVKQYAKDVARTWKKIMEEHKDTPWAILAQRESLSALGLEWRPSRD